MTEQIKAVEATAASSGRGLDVVRQPALASTSPAATITDHASTPPDHGELRDALKALLGVEPAPDVGLDYRVDPDLGRVIVELVDRKDGTVLRQIPNEEAQRLARLMKDGRGMLVHASV